MQFFFGGATILASNPKPNSGSQMVAGRFVNAYSTNDWTLGVAFRARYGSFIGCLVLALCISESVIKFCTMPFGFK